MDELGIDISGHYSKSVNEFDGQKFDYVITVCDSARESCPIFFGGAERLHHSFDDPAALDGSEEERLNLFRRVRDELRGICASFYYHDLRNNSPEKKKLFFRFISADFLKRLSNATSCGCNL